MVITLSWREFLMLNCAWDRQKRACSLDAPFSSINLLPAASCLFPGSESSLMWMILPESWMMAPISTRTGSIDASAFLHNYASRTATSETISACNRRRSEAPNALNSSNALSLFFSMQCFQLLPDAADTSFMNSETTNMPVRNFVVFLFSRKPTTASVFWLMELGWKQLKATMQL